MSYPSNIFEIINHIAKWYNIFGVNHIFFDKETIEISKVFAKQNVQSEVSLAFDTLDKLKEAVLKIDCDLKKTARNTVFSDGNPKSKIMIIGEAPGQEEDEQGRPFVGQSGQLLNNMLKSVGLKRDDVYITNIVFWRPPGNRNPTTDEIAACMPYLENHIKLIKPQIIMLLGGISVKALLKTNVPISKLRGAKTTYNGIKTITTFHPAYLLRSPGQKFLSFKDFISLKKSLISKIL